MKIKPNTIRTLGFGILMLSWGFAFYTVGIFHESRLVTDLLFGMFLLGMLTMLGMSMMMTMSKKERKHHELFRKRQKKAA